MLVSCDADHVIQHMITGDSEVQRTMLELLNQLDGFEATQSIKVVNCCYGNHVVALCVSISCGTGSHGN